jgi:sulfotransferase family protein
VLRARKEAEGAGTPAAPWEQLDAVEEYRELCRVRVEHLIEVRQPLVLISQIQRSGGTLLSQLFDDHPECHVDPYEIKIGHPKKHNWPPLDLARPESWFDILFFRGSGERLRRTGRTKKPDVGRSVFPFVFLPRLQKAIFDACVQAQKPASQRDVLDCYFTSYFNAWLDNQNLFTGPKKAVTGFTPRLAMDRENLEHFFAAYPDGTLISIVRDPYAWFESASKHMPEHYAAVDDALALWSRSVEAGLDARERYGERVLLLTYEQLVLDTEATMHGVAGRIGIAMMPQLLAPTFNGRPIRANSSNPVQREGILVERASADRASIDESTTKRIAELAGDRYERAIAAARFPG